MILLAWRSLLARRTALFGSLVAVALGAALVTAALLIGQAGDQARASGRLSTWRLEGTDVVVRPSSAVQLQSGLSLPLPGHARLTEDDINALRAAPGVTSVAVESPFPAYPVSADGNLVGEASKRSWGHPWSTALAEPSRLVAGTAPESARDVVLDRDLADAVRAEVGADVAVQTPRGIERFRLSGISDRPGSQFERAVYFDDATAAQLAGPPIMAFVDLAEGVGLEPLQQAVPGAELLTGPERSRALSLDLRQAELVGGGGQFIMMIAVLALVIAVFVISSTLSVSVQQRRRELAMLRTVGADPARLRRMILGEASLIGLVGGVVGAFQGIAIAAAGVQFFVAQEMMPRSATVTVTAFPVLAGPVAALLAAMLAGWVPARRAVGIAPAEAMRVAEVEPAAMGRGRRIIGSVCAAFGIVCLLGTWIIGGPLTSIAGSFSLVLLTTAVLALLLGVVLLGPTVLRTALRPLWPVLRRSFAGFVADRSIRADLRRAAGVSVPLTLLVVVACLLLFQDGANFQAKSRSYRDQLTADLVMVGKEQLGLPPVAAEAAEDVPGVVAASSTISTQVIADGPRVMRPLLNVTAVDPQALPQVMDLPLVAGSFQDFSDRAIAVSDTVAGERGWEVGQDIEIRLPDGAPASTRIAAVYHEPAGTTDAFVPTSLVAGRVLEPLAGAVHLRLASGADPGQMAAAVRDRVSAVAADVRVQTKEEHLAETERQSSGDNWIIVLVVVVLAGYAGISAMNVLIGSTMSRRRHFALLRLAGAAPGQVAWTLVAETAVTVLIAVVMGTVLSVLVLVSYAYLLTGDLWLPFALETYLGVVFATALAGVLGTAVPLRAALRASPTHAQ